MAETGSWYTLLDITAEARSLAAQHRSSQPTACPNDGEPLESGPDGSLHCKFDGWTWPRDGGWPW